VQSLHGKLAPDAEFFPPQGEYSFAQNLEHREELEAPMDFRLTPEQEQFKKALRAHCEKNIAPYSREIDEKEGGIPAKIINEHNDRALDER